ncbi:MAG: threonine-phosphate decarboxylase CobD [Pseudomonadota bacterium]
MPQPDKHGGELDRMRAAYPAAPPPWVDLSTGINPWPYPATDVSPEAHAQLPTARAYKACVEAFAGSIGAPAGSVLLSPGSELLIRLLPTVLGLKRVAILDPTYGDHAEVWHRAGCQTIETMTPLEYANDVDAVVVCNPNNPDGKRFERDALFAAHATLQTRGGYLIIDEAYADLSPDLSLAASGGRAGLIVFRSFGKFYGLAGLRLGALLAPETVRAQLSDQLGVWPISSAALEIGRRAYADEAWQSETRIALQRARKALDQLLRQHDLDISGGTDLFRFVHIEHASNVWDHLARSGIYVRKFSNLPHHLRIGLPKDPTETERLSAALSLLA